MLWTRALLIGPLDPRTRSHPWGLQMNSQHGIKAAASRATFASHEAARAAAAESDGVELTSRAGASASG